jgi:three-Cys-motif partner protein
MSWDDEFFDRRRLTSKLKHYVLRRYVKEFAYHLGTVYHVDGFAGAGEYGTGESHELGSPLLIAQLATDVATGPRSIQLRCLNVEADDERYVSLEAATAPFQPHIVEHNYHAEFVDVIPDILQRIGDAATFFFIDPFGTQGIAFDQLLLIFKRKATTEVLITLQTGGIATKAGWFAKENSTKPGERETARKLTQHLAAALDLPIEKLRAGWQESQQQGGTDAFEQRVRRWYMRRLKQPDRTRFKFSKSFPVLYRPGAQQSSICFHLMFATQNPKGLYEMNNAMANALEDRYAELFSGTLFPDFAEQRDQQTGRALARREILKHFANKTFTSEDVKQHCMQETECVLREGDYWTLVLDMRRRAELKQIESGRVTKNTQFTVNSSISLGEGW